MSRNQRPRQSAYGLRKAYFGVCALRSNQTFWAIWLSKNPLDDHDAQPDATGTSESKQVAERLVRDAIKATQPDWRCQIIDVGEYATRIWATTEGHECQEPKPSGQRNVASKATVSICGIPGGWFWAAWTTKLIQRHGYGSAT